MNRINIDYLVIILRQEHTDAHTKRMKVITIRAFDILISYICKISII